MKKIISKIKTQNGFTLIEMLVVVAVNAVLISTAIPVMNNQLESSREATDLANVRTAYAEVVAAAIVQDENAIYQGQPMAKGGVYEAKVPLKQTKDGWTTNMSKLNVAGISYGNRECWINNPKAGGVCTVTYDIGTGKVTLDWGGSAIPTSNWTRYNNAGQMALQLSATNKKGYYYGGSYYNTADENKEVFQLIAEELKKQNGATEVTITIDTNNAYQRKDENGKWVNAIMVSYVNGVYAPDEHNDVTVKKNGEENVTTRYFYDPIDGTLIAVWKQDGSWGVNGNNNSGFWGGAQKTYAYTTDEVLNSDKYSVRNDVSKTPVDNTKK